jgi:hypothetical protein
MRYCTRIVDISSGRLAEELREGKTQLLEMIASGVPLATTLDRLMLLIESQAPPVLCTIMLVAEDGVTMQAVSAPSMPPDYMASIDGLAIGPSVGSCGTAIYRKQNVVVSDIMTDPLWAPYKIPANFGLRACWATPIMANPTTVLGSFAMYYREPRSPTENDQQLIAAATQIARIAVNSTRREANCSATASIWKCWYRSARRSYSSQGRSRTRQRRTDRGAGKPQHDAGRAGPA